MNHILDALGLKAHNPGASLGKSGWSNDQRGDPLASENPATGEVIATVASATREDYDRILDQAGSAAAAWREVPAPVRGGAVRRVTEALRDHKDALGSLVALEMGKIKAEGDGEVQEMIDIGEFAVGQSRMLYGLTMHSERPKHRLYEQWHPLGVVGVITAFNFPVAVWSWNALLAAVCGNVNVWKPSPKTPLCAVAVQNICNAALADTDYPSIFYTFIDGDNALAPDFVDDARVDLVSFTGSSAVGRQVGERVAARMGKSLLELGGNNAIIVDESADLSLAIPGIVFGAVGTAGQRCTTTRRLFVHNRIIDEVVDKLAGAYAQVRIGDPLESNTLMGPLIDASSVERYREVIAQLRERGAEIVYGGNVLDQPGNFVEPTLVRAEPDWDLVCTETFAPILYVMGYDELEDAIAAQNAVPQGLSSSIFTNDLRRAERFLSASGSDCGIANVNIGTSGAEIGGAFGGEKDTGGGRESGSDAWKTYMRRQTNTINWGSDLPLAQGIKFDL